MTKDSIYNFKFNTIYKSKLINFLKENTTIENGGKKLFDGSYSDLLHIPSELAELIFFLKNHEKKRKKISHFLEIGFSHGIFNTLINKFFKIDTNIAIDPMGAHINGRVLNANLRFKNLILFCSYSNNTVVANHISKLSKFDLIYIDGSHEYQDVKNDFLTYKKIINKSGLIIFHDINVPNSGSKKYWNEIKKKYNYKEIVHQNQKFTYGYGILSF